MPEVVDLKKARLVSAARRGFRNWKSKFEETFDSDTRLRHISLSTIAFLALGKNETTFYLYDLIMNVEGLGSGFEFRELDSAKGMAVLDRYLFLLDRIRFETMKRLGWLEDYPGEDLSLVELIVQFDELAPSLQARPPGLSRQHPAYDDFRQMTTREREEFVRKLIPEAVKKMQNHSVTT